MGQYEPVPNYFLVSLLGGVIEETKCWQRALCQPTWLVKPDMIRDNMFDEHHFMREDIVAVNAAVVGISKNRWTALRRDEAPDAHALTKMRSNHFDVLPIVEEDGAILEYYKTEKWNNFSSVVRRELVYTDCLPIQTHIREVIKGLACDKRFFYFLTDDNRVVGLITAADLNNRKVRVYLFGLLSEFEVRLGDLIMDSLSKEEIQKINLKDTEKERFDEDRSNGLELPCVEYLYLSELLNLCTKHELFRRLGFASRGKFDDATGRLNELRKVIAHPTRSLVTKKDPVMRLWERIQLAEDLLFRLRQHLTTSGCRRQR